MKPPMNQQRPATATGEMSVMGSNGDTKLYWSANNWEEVANAKATFDLYLKDKKFLAFRMDGTGTKGEQMDAFDPSAGSILFVPPMVGG